MSVIFIWDSLMMIQDSKISGKLKKNKHEGAQI